MGSVDLAVRPLWENAKGAEGARWTKLLSDAIDKHGQGMMGLGALKDARTFCPKFSSLSQAQKKEFYIHLFSGIARYESNFKTSVPVFDEDRYKARTQPYNIYRGPIKPNSYSMGIFQQSYSAAPGYKPACGIDWNKDRGKDISDPNLTIYNPQIQMECAVAVMSMWVGKDGAIGGEARNVYDSRRRTYRFGGAGNYWGTMRAGNPARGLIIDSLKRFTPCWR